MKIRVRKRYPRINCCVKGCARGTTTVEPGVRIICRKCWQRAPKAMRDAAIRWRRRARSFERKGDLARAELAGRRVNLAFENIRKLLSNVESRDDGIPPLIQEELRKAGLL